MRSYKEYYQKNREKMIERSKKYNKKKRTEKNKYYKEYYRRNREKLLEYWRKYRADHKISEK